MSKKEKGDPADVAEFGDVELAGDPSVATLVRALQPSQREPYREERRATLRRVNESLGTTHATWADYLRSGESA